MLRVTWLTGNAWGERGILVGQVVLSATELHPWNASERLSSELELLDDASPLTPFLSETTRVRHSDAITTYVSMHRPKERICARNIESITSLDPQCDCAQRFKHMRFWGEAKSVDRAAIAEKMESRRPKIASYEVKIVFNMEETGLLF